ncbi:hypothetical protein PM082_020648 [Marasmius tenuissimus]|nr:hypothetical protein PM082_020648 [Marasmius tenuissimus]
MSIVRLLLNETPASCKQAGLIYFHPASQSETVAKQHDFPTSIRLAAWDTALFWHELRNKTIETSNLWLLPNGPISEEGLIEPSGIHAVARPMSPQTMDHGNRFVVISVQRPSDRPPFRSSGIAVSLRLVSTEIEVYPNFRSIVSNCPSLKGRLIFSSSGSLFFHHFFDGSGLA